MSTDLEPPAIGDRLESSSAPALFQQFVEKLIAESMLSYGERHPGLPPPAVEWNALWSAGDDLESPEHAIGRVVRVADQVARDIDKLGGDRALDVIDPPIALPSAVITRAVPTEPAPAPSLKAEAAAIEPEIELVDHSGTADVSISATDARRRRTAALISASTWVRNIGVLIICFAAWQVWGTGISHHYSQQNLQNDFISKLAASGVSKSAADQTTAVAAANGGHHAVTLISSSTPVQQPSEGSVVARIEIPVIGLNQYIVQGTEEGDLAMGPGHYIGTAMPGQAGNVAIAGHRTTYGAPFDRLDQVTPGSAIYLTTTTGEVLKYVVHTPAAAVLPSDVAVLNNFRDNRLTLTTCNPKFSASQRLVVTASLATPVTSAHPTSLVGSTTTGGEPATTTVTPYQLAYVAPVGWNMGRLPIVALIIAGLTALGLLNRRLKGHLGPAGGWLILTPIWICGLYLLFTALELFVPSTL